MSGAMERFYQEARKQAKLEVALELIKNGKNTFEEISKCTGLSLEEVKALAEGKSA